jgi:hypothetical protein
LIEGVIKENMSRPLRIEYNRRFGFGVGPREVLVFEGIIPAFAVRDGPILSFSRAKRPIFSDVSSERKRHFIPEHTVKEVDVFVLTNCPVS